MHCDGSNTYFKIFMENIYFHNARRKLLILPFRNFVFQIAISFFAYFYILCMLFVAIV